MRAGWHCSLIGCGKSTAGPSEESSDSFTVIGEAAHICGAASGPGSRRYDSSMTSAERKSIDNAIWLCADHARMIDRDEVTYSADELRAMKRQHEESSGRDLRLGKVQGIGAGLLAIGPDIICTGDIPTIGETKWVLHLKHFVTGDIHELAGFISTFSGALLEHKYILSDELGDGRLLSQAPTLSKDRNGYLLSCPLAISARRVDVKNLGSDMAMQPDTNDIYLDSKGNIARVSGLDYLPQKVRSLLSMQRGENVFAPKAGVRFFEYLEAFKGTPWLPLLMKLDVIRQAAIPDKSSFRDSEDTPLRCVTRVRGFELLSETPVDQRLPVRVDFEVLGHGRWQHDLSVYMPTREQMNERARLLAERPSLALS